MELPSLSLPSEPAGGKDQGWPLWNRPPKQDAAVPPTKPSVLSPAPSLASPRFTRPPPASLRKLLVHIGCERLAAQEGLGEPAFGPVSSPCPLPSKVSTDKAGGFGHCGNRAAEKWVGVIPQYMAGPSPSNGLSSNGVTGPGGGCQGEKTRLLRSRGTEALGRQRQGMWVARQGEQGPSYSASAATRHPWAPRDTS